MFLNLKKYIFESGSSDVTHAPVALLFYLYCNIGV